MKKLRMLLISLLLVTMPLLSLSGCSGESDVEMITERFFVQQVSSILQNLDTYTGRTIQLEGMFFSWGPSAPGADDMYHFVVRFMSGCCGDEGNVGFEVYMGDFESFTDNTWVSVTGVLELRDGWQPNTPMLVVTAIEALAERGQEIVFS